jgi:hypothetical protein
MATGDIGVVSASNTESAVQAASSGPYRPALVIPNDVDILGNAVNKTVLDTAAGWMYKSGAYVPSAAVDGAVTRGEYLTFSSTAKKFSGTNAFVRRPLKAQAIALESIADEGNIAILLLSPSPQRCLRARVYNNADLNFAADGVVSFNTEDYDPYGMHDNSTNPSRLTIPADQAVSAAYHISGHITWSAAATYWLFIRLNGVTWLGGDLTDNNSLSRSISTTHVLSAGDYVELYVIVGGASVVKYYAKYSPVFSIVQLGE